MTTTATPAGVVLGMDDTTYHSRPELSSTGARRILESPARFRWEQAHRRESRAFDLGHAVHARILGTGPGVIAYPDEHLTPSGNPSTKAATVAWASEQRAASLVPVSTADATLVDHMAEAVLAHPAARRHLEQPGDPEASVFATDPNTGIDVRARFDLLADTPVDLKTTAGSAGPHGFARDAARYSYPVQEAHYLTALKWATGTDAPPMVFVVVEKAPPHLVAVHRFDDITRIVGHDLAARARTTYAECLETDTWPAYSDDVLTTQLPGWWLDHLDADDDLELA